MGRAHLVEFPELVPQLLAALIQGLALQAAQAWEGDQEIKSVRGWGVPVMEQMGQEPRGTVVSQADRPGSLKALRWEGPHTSEWLVWRNTAEQVGSSEGEVRNKHTLP